MDYQMVKKMIEKDRMKHLLIPLQIISLASPLRGKIKLQKLVFLTQNKSDKQVNYGFEPAPLGPLSDELNSTLTHMSELGLIHETVEKTSSGNEVFCYSITKSGSQFLDFGTEFGNLSSKTKNIIESVYSKYGKMSYVELLDYIHEEFPEYHIKNINF